MLCFFAHNHIKQQQQQLHRLTNIQLGSSRFNSNKNPLFLCQAIDVYKQFNRLQLMPLCIRILVQYLVLTNGDVHAT